MAALIRASFTASENRDRMGHLSCVYEMRLESVLAGLVGPNGPLFTVVSTQAGRGCRSSFAAGRRDARGCAPPCAA